MKYLAGLFAFAIAASTAGAQDFKIGTVDMSRVFGEYFKTKEAEKELETRREEAKAEVAEQEKELKALGEKLQALKKAAEDPGSSVELRRAKAKQLEEEAAKAQEVQRSVIEFARRRESQLLEMFNRRRDGLMKEIQEKVSARSTADGYDLVFDRSARSTRGVPFLLYSKDARDFSAEMIAELNASQP